MFKLAFLPLALLALASCGGDSGTDDFQVLSQQAAAKEVEATSLAPASPCGAATQCGVLTFQHNSGHCAARVYHPYSLVSSTATAADTTAHQQVDLAVRALAVAPPPATSCTQSIELPPSVACVSNTCRAAAAQ